MPADYLSRLPAFEVEKMDPVAAFDPFQLNFERTPAKRYRSTSNFPLLKKWILVASFDKTEN